MQDFDQQPRAFLVGAELKRDMPLLDVEASLEELALLAHTADIHVIGQSSQRLDRIDPATYIGSGKVEEVRDWVEELGANVVIFDDELSPRHLRELEKIFGEEVRLLDRTALILDIFARHARTREGALQVELAQYQYRLPRLTRQWTHLARQAGGAAARGGAGGVGLRGPGETQLETDRRDISRRIAHIQRELEDVRAHRSRHRMQRRKAGMPTISLVGYTNAGKSTLLNALSGADIYVADRLFATLDPTTRRVELPGGRHALFTDTVGFIQKLPHTLVASFRATLEEIVEADLLLHVVDITHPHALQQVAVVEQTLAELGAESIPCVVVLNKLDRRGDAEPGVPESLIERYPDAIQISALKGSGIDELLADVEDELVKLMVRVRVMLPYKRGALIARFHEIAIVEHEEYQAEGVALTGILWRSQIGPYEPFQVNERS